MFTFTKKKLLAAGVGLSVSLLSSAASAAWPEKPITLIVPWGAGGGTDTTARIVGKALSEKLGVPVNVVNRTGGQGVIGHSAIANAKPDGYTLGLMTAEITMMHWTGLTDLTYKSYTPLGKFAGVVGGLQVKKGSKFSDAKQILDYIEKNPGKLKASGGGYGSVWQLNLAGLLNTAGLKPDAVRWVPSEGAAPALQELVAGGVDFTSTSINESDAMIQAGQVDGIVVMSEKRSEYYPEVPTIDEAANISWRSGSWNGLVGPKGLPEEVVSKLLPLVKEIQNSEEIHSFANKRRLNIFPVTGAKWEKELASIDAAMGKTMKVAGIIK
ncbi:tripartite tricarboxylate transporter substrate binding protein [Vibrio sp. 99-8-1]|uniref:tripartite tricarboxylate transporter substrate binding protein n=1 Tax=Vibrio sp. 99-8-1 TaxID=2607602 RepID=UPI00149358D3|nr:tripartite tricarboxylate transporter substrate binding protein [Vibrio sp. 99-8-1]NOI64986.1 tripartite tricarboxylate transporter substrate binding protein [Vibrio sp. 99-8-1]